MFFDLSVSSLFTVNYSCSSKFLQLHILPREVLGRSTFSLSMWLLNWFPVKLVDRFLLICSQLILGDTHKMGIRRPKMGPLEQKNSTGKTPVLDVGAFSKIKSGKIKVNSSFPLTSCLH